MKNMNRHLYQLHSMRKMPGAKVVLLIMNFNFIAETFAIEALPVELHLMLVMVRSDLFWQPACRVFSHRVAPPFRVVAWHISDTIIGQICLLSGQKRKDANGN